MLENLTPEQEKELYESMKAEGYKQLKGEKRELYKKLKVKFESDSPEVDEVENLVDEVEKPKSAKTPITEGSNAENPFQKKPHQEEKQLNNEKIDSSASYVIKDNILSGDNYFKKGQIISGSHRLAQNFLKENLISKYE